MSEKLPKESPEEIKELTKSRAYSDRELLSNRSVFGSKEPARIEITDKGEHILIPTSGQVESARLEMEDPIREKFTESVYSNFNTMKFAYRDFTKELNSVINNMPYKDAFKDPRVRAEYAKGLLGLAKEATKNPSELLYSSFDKPFDIEGLKNDLEKIIVKAEKEVRTKNPKSV